MFHGTWFMAEVRRDVGVLARLWLTLLCTLVVLAGTLVYCAGPTGDAAATPVDQEMVAQVRIEGNEAQPIEKVVRFIHTRASRPLEQDKIDEDVRRLNNSRMFVDVKASTQKADDGTIVIFTVKERAVFRYVRFVGCKGIKRNVLAKETGLKTGEPMDPYLVTEAKRKIVDYYQSKGYARIFVDVFEGDKPGDRGAVFIIHEGAKEKIQWTGFEGNAFASDGQLRTHIKQKPGFLWIFRGEVDRKEIDEDVNRVTDYYRSMGFYKATVGKELHYNEAHSWLSLTYVIDEGPRYQVRKVSVVGAKKFTDKELLTDTKLKPGMFYNRNDMLSDVNRMRDIYGGEGYIFTDIEADTQFQAAPGTLDLVYLVRESNRFRVGKVNPHIKGEYPHTRESTVRNRISQFPGQYVDTREMRASEARLKRSGLFAIDPSRNVMPKVTVAKPGAEKDREKEDIEVAEQPARPAGLRGQSPDPQPEFQSDAPADRSQSQEP
jgi:outer membrane protein insertion porin family